MYNEIRIPIFGIPSDVHKITRILSYTYVQISWAHEWPQVGTGFKKMKVSEHLFDVQLQFCVAIAQGSAPLPCVACPKTVADMRHLKRIWTDDERCISRGRRSTRDVFIKDARRSGRWFLACILEHQIFRVARMILRDRCNTSCDLALLWRGRRNGPDKSLNALVRGRHSALNIACLKEFSQNCFDVVKFKNKGSLTEFLPLCRCQVQKWSKSRGITITTTLH